MNLRAPLTQSDFGALVGISQQSIAALLAAGVLREGAPAAEWLLAYASHLRAMASGRTDDPDVSAQRLRRAKAAAERAEIQIAVLRGELVNAAAVEFAYDEKVAAARDAFEAIPDRISAQLAAESDTHKTHTMLSAEIRLAMTRFAQTSLVSSRCAARHGAPAHASSSAEVAE